MDAPQYVQVDVSSDYVINRMFYSTHHNDMGARQYVYIDVPSDNFCNWMFSYITAIWTLASMYTLMYLQIIFVTECFLTHHSDMDAPQYEHVDVSSD